MTEGPDIVFSEEPEIIPDHRASRPNNDAKSNFFGSKPRMSTPARATRKTSRAEVPNKPGQFVEPLTKAYGMIAMAIMPFDQEIAMAIISPTHEPTEENPNPPIVAEQCARAWDEAAQRSPALRRMLNGFVTTSVLGMLVTAHAPIIAVVLKNHTPLGNKVSGVNGGSSE